MEQTTGPIYLRFGGASKSSFEMSDEELEQAAASILRRAKEKAFSRGLPIYYGKDGKVYAEYSDGHIEEMKANQ
jgi:hypothetical protein